MWLNFRLKVRHFFQKYKKVILVIAILWTIIIAVNYLLGWFLAKQEENQEQKPTTTYEPNQPVMGNDDVPKKVQEPISNLIDTYINYCNNKDYQKAYDLISQDCKNALYPTLEDFQKYVDLIFPHKKIYNIQNYSNVDKNYIYNVRILDDIMATGLTGEDYLYYEEKFSIKQINDGLQLSIRGYIQKEEINKGAEDDYIKVYVKSRDVYYDKEVYTVQIQSKVNQTMVIQDQSSNTEVQLNIGDQYRNMETNYGTIVIDPLATQTFQMEFTKFFDDGRTSSGLRLTDIRIYNQYTGQESDNQDGNLIKRYGIEVSIK